MRRQRRAGFTLIELMISLTLLGIIMGGVVTTVLSMQRGYVRGPVGPLPVPDRLRAQVGKGEQARYQESDRHQREHRAREG